jgi:hypothetical protein
LFLMETKKDVDDKEYMREMTDIFREAKGSNT